MVKTFLRNTVIYGVSLFLLPKVVAGVIIVGGVQTLAIGGFALTVMFMLLKPIFNVLTFPFNVVTLGLFSVITNAVILYLLTVFVPNIGITSFTFPGTSIAGFSVNSIQFNTLFAFLTAAVVLTTISGSIRWLLK